MYYGHFQIDRINGNWLIRFLSNIFLCFCHSKSFLHFLLKALDNFLAISHFSDQKLNNFTFSKQICQFSPQLHIFKLCHQQLLLVWIHCVIYFKLNQNIHFEIFRLLIMYIRSKWCIVIRWFPRNIGLNL